MITGETFAVECGKCLSVLGHKAGGLTQPKVCLLDPAASAFASLCASSTAEIVHIDTLTKPLLDGVNRTWQRHWKGHFDKVC